MRLHQLEFPIGLAYLVAGAEAAGHQVALIDAPAEAPHSFWRCAQGKAIGNGLQISEILDRIPLESKIIAVSCMFSVAWIHTKELLEAIRQRFPDRILIIGGEHASAVPEHCLRTSPADLVVLGEGEETLLELLREAAQGNPIPASAILGIAFLDKTTGNFVRTPPRERIQKLDSLPIPAWEQFAIPTYFDVNRGTSRGSRAMPLLLSRGCPYACSFCSNHDMWQSDWVIRSLDTVIKELKWLKERYQIDHVAFYDCNANLPRAWMKEFIDTLNREQLGLTWSTPLGIRTGQLDIQLLRQMKEVGCVNLGFAPECGSKRLLKSLNKNIDLDRIVALMRGCVTVGIPCFANIMIGLPGETHRDAWKTVILLARLGWIGATDIHFNIYVPLPGNAVFDQLMAKGAFADQDLDELWLDAVPASFLRPKSYSKYISSFALRLYALAGLSLFHGIQLSRRPSRALRLVIHTWRGTPRTILESFVYQNLHSIMNFLGMGHHEKRTV